MFALARKVHCQRDSAADIQSFLQALGPDFRHEQSHTIIEKSIEVTSSHTVYTQGDRDWHPADPYSNRLPVTTPLLPFNLWPVWISHQRAAMLSACTRTGSRRSIDFLEIPRRAALAAGLDT